MKLYAKIQKIFDMTKLWLGKVGALLRIIQKETVSVTFDTASRLPHIHLPHHPLSHLDSTHTPARGVTHLAWVVVADVAVSIHTPARGVTFDDYA